MSSKRIVFTFDERARKVLEDFRRDGNMASLAEGVREALSIARGLQVQANLGYSEVLVRNPKTGDFKELVGKV